VSLDGTRKTVEQLLGLAIVAAVLVDVFLTVLYPRLGTSIMSYRLGRATGRLFQAVARRSRRRRGTILSYCGPVNLLVLVGFWILALTVGTGLVIHPVLGTSVTTSHGATPRDFISAMYAGGSSIALVGASDFAPRSSAFRLFYLFDSLVGIVIVSVTLTYLMQVYTALLHRNTLALQVHLASLETGDAAELLAHLLPEGQFQGGYTNLSDLAARVCAAKEGHHFYPVLFYFRFREPHYSVSRISFVCLDTVTLIRTALEDRRTAWLRESVAVAQLWEGSLELVRALTSTFVREAPDLDARVDERTAARWRRRYVAATDRLREAGIWTTSDERRGAEAYVALRARWDPYIAALAPLMGYEMPEVDPAG
jgi:hypothetical protein